MQENLENKDNDSVTPVNSIIQTKLHPMPAGEAGKNNNFLIMLLSVLLLVSVLIAGFFAFQTQRLVKELRVTRDELTTKTTLEPTTEPVATQYSEVDSTTGWKNFSYKNYSFKLPTNWDTYIGISEGKSDQLFIAPSEKITQIKKTWESGSGFGGGPFLNMSIQMNDDSESYIPKSDEYSKVTIKEIVVSGVTSKLYITEVLQSSPMGEPGDKLYSAHVVYNNKYYNIQLFDDQYKTEFDQILSTFKFTN